MEEKKEKSNESRRVLAAWLGVHIVFLLNEMWVHSPPLGAQGNFKRKEKHDTM